MEKEPCSDIIVLYLLFVDNVENNCKDQVATKSMIKMATQTKMVLK